MSSQGKSVVRRDWRDSVQLKETVADAEGVQSYSCTGTSPPVPSNPLRLKSGPSSEPRHPGHRIHECQRPMATPPFRNPAQEPEPCPPQITVTTTTSTTATTRKLDTRLEYLHQSDPSKSSGSSPPDCPRVLEQRHRAELHASGLTDATIEAMGCYLRRCGRAPAVGMARGFLQGRSCRGPRLSVPRNQWALYAKIKLNTLVASSLPQNRRSTRASTVVPIRAFLTTGQTPRQPQRRPRVSARRLSMKLRFTGSHAATCL